MAGLSVKSDYSEWLVGDRLKAEDEAWRSCPERTAYHVSLVTKWNPGDSVLEIGCGAGLLAAKLAEYDRYDYVGVDKNVGCLALAQQRNPHEIFVLADVRDFASYEDFDLVCAFAFFKHFALSEWEEIVARVLSWVPVAVFSMNMADLDYDDGEEFPHTSVTEKTLSRACLEVGHRIVWRDYEPESCFVTQKGRVIYD